MKILTYFIIWLVSLGGFMYVEHFRHFEAKIEDSGNNMELIGEFDNFYEIFFSTSRRTAGYKHETLSKNGDGYTYTIEISLAPQRLRGLDIFSLNGQVNFDVDGFIQNFVLTVGDDIEVSGQAEPETPDKILVSYKNTSGFNPLNSVENSKLIDTKDLNLDMFFMKSLPYKDMEIGKTYSNQVINPSFLGNLDKVNFSDILITKLDDYNYEIKQKIGGFDIDMELEFDKDGNVIRDKNPVSTSVIIRDENKIRKLSTQYGPREEEEVGEGEGVGEGENNSVETKNLSSKNNEGTSANVEKEEVKKCNLLKKF